MMTSKSDVAKRIIRYYGTVIVAILVFVFFSVSANGFFTLKNVMLLLKQMSALTIITLGFTFVMAVGGFDMSVGYSTGLVGIILVKILMNTTNFWLALLGGIAVGLVIGCANGLLTSYVGLPDFIATFAMGSVIYGVKMMMTEGNPIYVKGVEGAGIDLFRSLNSKMLFGVVPVMAVIMLVFIVLCFILMEKTTLGWRIYAIGGNREAALFCGINVRRYKFISYVISSLAVAFSAVLVCSRLNSAQPTSGEGYLMDAISACYLGTTMFGEGQPTVLGSVVGAFIIAMLSNGLTMLGMTYYFQDITTGVVVIVAVLLSVVNGMTKDKIEINTRRKIDASRREALWDYAFEDRGVTPEDCITGVYRALDGDRTAGYVYEMESKGYGGVVYLCVGIDASGQVAAVRVSGHSETKGLGTPEGEAFLSAFAGLSAREGAAQEVEAITGATVSSTAVRRAVDQALTHYATHYAQEAAE